MNTRKWVLDIQMGVIKVVDKLNEFQRRQIIPGYVRHELVINLGEIMKIAQQAMPIEPKRYYAVERRLPFYMLAWLKSEGESKDIEVLFVDWIAVESLTPQDERDMATREDCRFLIKVPAQGNKEAIATINALIKEVEEKLDSFPDEPDYDDASYDENEAERTMEQQRRFYNVQAESRAHEQLLHDEGLL